MQEGIIHLLRRIAEVRGENPDSGWDWIVEEPALAPLLPLIHYAVPDTVLPLSEAARGRCARAYYQTVAHNLCLYRELGSVLEVLRGAEIPAVVLKGAALALTLYPSIGLRPMSDVDLLVPRSQMPEASACLKARGYVEPTPGMVPDLNRAVGRHVSLDSGNDVPLRVEVHWTLATGEHDRHAPSMAWFWQQTEPFSLGRGARVPGSGGAGEPGSQGELSPLHSRSPAPLLTLTPTAHLLYLAAHLMLHHGGARASLIWFHDIDLMVRCEAHRLDWDELSRRAQEFHWAAALYAALRGVQDRFGTPLPEGFLGALAEARDHRVARLVEWKADPLQTRATSVRNFMSTMDWQGRLRLALAIAFPSPAYVRWRYKLRPEWLWPLSYLCRWLDILREGLSTALKLAMRRRGDGAEGRGSGPR